METEVLSIVERAVQGGIASSLWPVLLLSTIASGFGAYFGAYFKKKAEHKAAQEDFHQLLDHVTQQTRVVKAIEKEMQESLFYRTEILLPRLEAYKTLWATSHVIRPTRKVAIFDCEKNALRNSLTSWYYQGGNGMFLSLRAGELFRKARGTLSFSDDNAIKTAFSELREQLKADVKVYEPQDREVDLGT